MALYDFMYKVNWVLVVCKDYEKYRKILKDCYDIEMVRDNQHGFAQCGIRLSEGHAFVCIWMKEWNIEALCHEVFHGVQKVLHDKGIVLTDDSDESYAYYLEMVIKAFKQRGG
jgi:pyruvate-formate lyase